MTKKELIKELGNFTNKKKKELEKMTKAELEKLLNELDANRGDNTDNADKTDSAEKESTGKEVEPKEEWKEAEFFSFCGFPFDPDENSECYTMCKEDSPEEFNKCLENFKKKPVAPKKKKKKKSSGEGTNRFGRRIGSQAALIEKALDEEEPMTVKELAEYAGCEVNRVRRHFRRLIHTEQKAKVLIDSDGKVFFLSRFPDKEGTSAYPKHKDSVDDVDHVQKKEMRKQEEKKEKKGKKGKK